MHVAHRITLEGFGTGPPRGQSLPAPPPTWPPATSPTVSAQLKPCAAKQQPSPTHSVGNPPSQNFRFARAWELSTSNRQPPFSSAALLERRERVQTAGASDSMPASKNKQNQTKWETTVTIKHYHLLLQPLQLSVHVHEACIERVSNRS
jgi:hypothetical protein